MNNNQKNSMKRINLKGGYVDIPQDWVVLTELGDSTQYTYAGIVTIFASSLAKNVPHFVFVSDYKYGDLYPDALIDTIREACIHQYPQLENVPHDSYYMTHIPEANSFEAEVGYLPCGISIVRE